MKIVVQRVTKASVEVENKIVGSIGAGVVVFAGFTHDDTMEKGKWLASKLVNLRIFEDDMGKINRSLLDCSGAALIISQFTLYGDCNGGRRPSFTKAALPEFANKLYEDFIEEVRNGGVPVSTGIFGAQMKVDLINDGPLTFVLER